MAEADCSNTIDKIWKALRLVPEFDGNSHVLVRFLEICDNLVSVYLSDEEGAELSNSALINGILNKITGPAARVLTTNGIPGSWAGIRHSLINSFSDHRDECSLYTDLSLLTQGSDSPNVFYERVQNTLSTIMTYVQLHESIESTVEAKRQLYCKLALKTFIRGLNEPIGSRIRCMRPDTLQEALEFATEEMNVAYLQNKNYQGSFRKPNNFSYNQKPFNLPLFNQKSSGLSPQFPVNQIARPTFYSNQNFAPQGNQTTDYSHPKPQFLGPSRTQQMMKSLPRSNMSTGFRIPPRFNHPQNYPSQNHSVPMSGVSHPVARTLPPYRQMEQRQIHMNETAESEYYDDLTHDQYYYDPDCTDQNENFAIEYNINSETKVPEPNNQNFYSDPDPNAPE